MVRSIRFIAFLWMGLMVGGAMAHADKRDAEQVIVNAGYTMERMWDHPEFSRFVRHYFKQAKAVLIIPEMFKGGFFIGGEGGTGVLMAKAQDNQWSYPAFISAASASFGLQFGGQYSELLLLVMTSKGLEAILEDQVQIGGEISGAVGPYGSGLEASTTTNLGIVDIIAYSIAKGAFIGVNVEGTALITRESWLRDYYGQTLSPRAVVIEGAAGNEQADFLREMLHRYASH